MTRELEMDGRRVSEQLRGVATSIGAWSNLLDPRLAFTMASADFDWVCIDQQHGYATGGDSTDLLAAVHAGGAAALVRVAWNRPEDIGRVLDAGADGVIVPMVESASETRAAVSAARYAPMGQRSWGGSRGPYSVLPTDPAHSNASIACLVMVESPAAVDQVESIAAVEGIDGIFVGPFDLSLAYGLSLDALLADEGERSPLRRVVRACEANGIVPGAYGGTVERSALLQAHGYRMLAVSSDDALVAEACATTSADARRRLG